MAKKLPPDAIDPLATMYGETFFDLMTAMIKSDTVEAGFAQIQEAARTLTKKEMKRIADAAGRYCAEHANPSPGEVPRNRWETLKKKALEFALRLDNRDTKKNKK